MKHTDDLLVAKVFTCCLTKDSTISEITKQVYGNSYAKNEIQVYRVIEFLINKAFVTPVVNKGLKFGINVDKILSSLIESKHIIQLGNNKFSKNIKNNSQGVK